MSIYQEFCTETFDGEGRLTDFRLRYGEHFNFGYDVVDRIARETPERRALVWCNPEGEEHIFTFGDLMRLSNQAANVLAGRGIGRGDRVLVLLKRHYEYWICAVALHKLGAVLIPATHMLTADDLVYRIERAEVKGIVCTAQNEVPQKVLEAVRRTNPDIRCWTVQAGYAGFENLTAALEGADETFARRETLASDPMLIYFTSGTTGYPKGVIHDFTYPLAHIVTAKYWQQAQDGGLHFTVAETGWGKASWGKIYGQWLVGSAVMVYDFDHFDPKQLISVINRYGVTSFCAPATV